MVRGLTLHLTADVGAPASARGAVRDIIGTGATAEVVELLLSELVTNVVRHGSGAGQVVVSVQEADGDWVVEVHGPGTLSEGGRPTVGGFGLVLVDGLAEDWGMDAGDGEVRSWFRLTAAPDGP